jgi:hypothetical protein
MPTTNPQGKVLGILKPVGGGDPIPLFKPELIIGRRRSCDICLDFANISGKHCMLRLVNSVWHVRDLGSTNGTSLNGMLLSSEHSVMPDDELKIASRLFTIDYEPAGPEAVLHKQDLIEEVSEEAQARRHSLMELAGIDTDQDKPRQRGRSSSQHVSTPVERPRAGEPVFEEGAIPEDFQGAPPPPPRPLAADDDDDFLKLIEEDVKKAKERKR